MTGTETLTIWLPVTFIVAMSELVATEISFDHLEKHAPYRELAESLYDPRTVPKECSTTFLGWITNTERIGFKSVSITIRALVAMTILSQILCDDETGVEDWRAIIGDEGTTMPSIAHCAVRDVSVLRQLSSTIDLFDY